MAKERSKKSGKSREKASNPPKAPATRAAKDARAPKTTGKVKPGVRKQLRRLEGELNDAARLERKRLRKLERARNRRQLIEASLDAVRGLVPQAPAPKPAPAKAVPAAKEAAKPAPAARATAVKASPSARKAAPAAGTPAKAPARPRLARPAATRTATSRTRPTRPAASPQPAASDAPPAGPAVGSTDKS
jgi:hypothetical protein